MNFLCKCIGGSHMYGLEGPDSDIDYRGIFANDKINTIIGLDRFEHQDLKTETEDAFYFEIRHYLNSLRKTNTQALELLYNDTWMEIRPLFQQIQKVREQLTDSNKLYSSLTGYMHGEVRLANGERQGDIGKKRRTAVEKYGFSPKNWVNLFRLAHCGAYFFETGIYPTNFCKFLPVFGKVLKDLKNNPERYQLSDLQKQYGEHKQMLDEAYAATTVNFKFNTDIANDFLVLVYGPQIEEHLEEIRWKYSNYNFLE